MSLLKGEIKFGNKILNKNSTRFFFKRYLKKNLSFNILNFKDKSKFEVLNPVKIDDFLEFNVEVDFIGSSIKEISLRSLENLSKEESKNYESWILSSVGNDLNLKDDNWIKFKLKWGELNLKIIRNKEGVLECLTVKIVYN